MARAWDEGAGQRAQWKMVCAREAPMGAHARPLHCGHRVQMKNSWTSFSMASGHPSAQGVYPSCPRHPWQRGWQQSIVVRPRWVFPFRAKAHGGIPDPEVTWVAGWSRVVRAGWSGAGGDGVWLGAKVR